MAEPCHASGNLLPSLWQSCAITVAELCHHCGNTLSSSWQDCHNGDKALSVYCAREKRRATP
ncbi:hypothetical protein DXD68_08305 [Parabacteroides sp. TM07-1AC]|nr:hypothetical protein DXD68_08305 [Parabacteroides sp. TM07-1AC]